MVETLLVVVLVILALIVFGIGILLWRIIGKKGSESSPELRQHMIEQEGRISELQRSESRNLREELTTQLGHSRKELSDSVDSLKQAVQQRMDVFGEGQTKQGERTATVLKENREELSKVLLDRLGKVETAQTQLSEKTAKSLNEMRESLTESVNKGMKEIQTKNDEKLELMRKTVDEKLHQTLETRLTQSFEVVTKQLLDVQKGLSAMQTLAQDVGGLKNALTNVKVRGMFGEVQLGALLEQFLAPDQYLEDTPVKPRGGERVEFAVKLPGPMDSEPVLLPIDAKFPIEDYQRLNDAYEAGDKGLIDTYGKALEARINGQAADIKNKYIQLPYTTDFALLFLPVEGLFAEVIRRGNLFVEIQRKYKVTIVGPTTLSAFLNSLQVGFKTLAISKQSSEVWKVLGAVRNEFGKFGDALLSVQKNLDSASSNLGKVTERSRQMERKLKGVDSLPDAQAQAMFPELGADTEPTEE